MKKVLIRYLSKFFNCHIELVMMTETSIIKTNEFIRKQINFYKTDFLFTLNEFDRKSHVKKTIKSILISGIGKFESDKKIVVLFSILSDRNYFAATKRIIKLLDYRYNIIIVNVGQKGIKKSFSSNILIISVSEIYKPFLRFGRSIQHIFEDSELFDACWSKAEFNSYFDFVRSVLLEALYRIGQNFSYYKMIGLPFRKMEAWLINDLMLKLSIPTYDYHVVIQSSHPKFFKSPAKFLSLMDTSQLEIYQNLVNYEERSYVLAGSFMYQDLHSRSVEISNIAVPKGRYILLVTQYTEFDSYFKMASDIALLMKNDMAISNIRLLIKCHPRHSKNEIHKFIELSECYGNIVVLTSDNTAEDLSRNSLMVLTMYSNVALYSALNSVPVAIINFYDLRLPVDFSSAGIGYYCSSLESFYEFFYSVLFAGVIFRQASENQNKFINSNKHLLNDQDEEFMKFLSAE